MASRSLNPGVIAAAIATVALVAYSPALGGGWILDDALLIASNRYVQDFTWLPRWFSHDFWAIDHPEALSDRLTYWRPLVSATYALDWRLSGGHPLLFHVTNLLLHGGVAAVAFFTLRRWLSNTWAAALAALLFSVHPSKAESVAWISGRTDILVTLGVLVAVAGLNRRLLGKRFGLSLEIIGSLVAYLSKEQAIILPAVAAVEAWATFGHNSLDRGRLIRIARAIAPHVAVAVLYLLLRQHFMPLRQFEISGLPSSRHGLLILESLGRYVEVLGWPADLSLGSSLVRTGTNGVLVSPAYVVLGGLLLLSAVFLIVGQRLRRPGVCFGAGLLLVTLLPVSNVVWAGFLTLISPRFLYLPLLGAVLAAVALATRPGRLGRTLQLLL